MKRVVASTTFYFKLNIFNAQFVSQKNRQIQIQKKTIFYAASDAQHTHSIHTINQPPLQTYIQTLLKLSKSEQKYLLFVKYLS